MLCVLVRPVFVSHIDLSQNQLGGELPDPLGPGMSTNLRYLDASSNYFTSLSASIGSYSSLT